MSAQYKYGHIWRSIELIGEQLNGNLIPFYSFSTFNLHYPPVRDKTSGISIYMKNVP